MHRRSMLQGVEHNVTMSRRTLTCGVWVCERELKALLQAPGA